MRAGADDAHVAHQYVKELREFVKAGLAHETADRGDAIIIHTGLSKIAGIIHPHTSELVTGERFVISACTHLFKENRSAALKFNEDSQHRIKPAENKYNNS